MDHYGSVWLHLFALRIELPLRILLCEVSDGELYHLFGPTSSLFSEAQDEAPYMLVNLLLLLIILHTGSIPTSVQTCFISILW